jgi:tagaturonate epimerase
LILLSPLGLTPSFGFGDRLGLATRGHIAALQGSRMAPLFAQQSVRENARTGRTPRQVIEDARRDVEAAGWEAPWGADADHLGTLADLQPFVEAGYTFFTVDCGAYVDNAADDDPLAVVRERVAGPAWEELSAVYLPPEASSFGAFNPESLLRAVAKYGRAVEHAVGMYRHLSQLKESFDFEISVDETDSPTTPLEHFFIANELTRRRVNFTSLAPRFIGRFEKGVDYLGDLAALDRAMALHAAVTDHFGTYKISLHSGSDKFKVYPILVKHWGDRIHIKTAGTSYLEALRTLAEVDPDLFARIWSLGLERYPADRLTYHVSAEAGRIPPGIDLSALLDDFNAREILHVTYGSALKRFGIEMKASLTGHLDLYHAKLQTHFRRHLELLR